MREHPAADASAHTAQKRRRTDARTGCTYSECPAQNLHKRTRQRAEMHPDQPEAAEQIPAAEQRHQPCGNPADALSAAAEDQKQQRSHHTSGGRQRDPEAVRGLRDRAALRQIAHAERRQHTAK